jgi:hypothetical protein
MREESPHDTIVVFIIISTVFAFFCACLSYLLCVVKLESRTNSYIWLDDSYGAVEKLNTSQEHALLLTIIRRVT